MAVTLNGVTVGTIKINGANATVKLNGAHVFPVGTKIWMFLYDTTSQLPGMDVIISKNNGDFYNEQDAFQALEAAYPASSMAVGSLASAGWYKYYIFEVQFV